MQIAYLIPEFPGQTHIFFGANAQPWHALVSPLISLVHGNPQKGLSHMIGLIRQSVRRFT